MLPMKCPECKDYFFLEVHPVRFEKDNCGVDYNTPFLDCKNCGNRKQFFPLETWEELAEKDHKGFKEGEYVRMVFKYEIERFERFKRLGFKYDPTDYYFIPGLERDIDEGYLQPVFFDKDILLYYNNHSDYLVDFTSFFSGISCQNKKTWGNQVQIIPSSANE